jgi:hypothetical protein
MLRQIAIAVVLLPLLATAFAQAPKHQSQQPSPKAGQYPPTQQERGTENSPVIVKVLPTEKPKDELDREIEKQESDRQLVKLTGNLATYTKALFIATGILALITAGLVVVGFFQVRDAKAAIAAAVKSANVAERALTDLERPYLFILDYNWLLVDAAKEIGAETGWAYIVANVGKLPAVITRVSSGTRFGRSIPPLNDEPAIAELLTAPLIGADERRKVKQSLSNDDDPRHECEIRGGKAIIPGIAFKTGGVIVKICIEYDGPLTRGHVTTACWEWHPVKHAFTQHGGPKDNQRT